MGGGNGGEGEITEFEFSMIDQEDYAGIDAYVKRHGLHDASMAEVRRAKAARKGQEMNGDVKDAEAEVVKKEEEEERDGEDDEEEDEEGEDYDPGSEGESEGSGDSTSASGEEGGQADEGGDEEDEEDGLDPL